MAQFVLVDPFTNKVVHGVLVRDEKGCYYVRGPGVKVKVPDIEELRRLCTRVGGGQLRLGWFSLKQFESHYVCLGRIVDDTFYPVEKARLFLAIDLDLKRTLLEIVERRFGDVLEAHIVVSDHVGVKVGYITYETLSTMLRYRLVDAPGLTVVSGGFREKPDQATGRVYLQFVPGLPREQLEMLTRGYELVRFAQYLTEDEKRRLAHLLAMPALYYRRLYLEAIDALERVIEEAERSGAELLARYAKAELEKVSQLPRVAEDLGISIEALQALVKVRQARESEEE